MSAPRAFLRRIAAATAIICDELGGGVDRFELMKILYASDRDSLAETGRTISGDTYYSLQKGPILSATLDFARGRGQDDLQKEWNKAFGIAGVSVYLIRGVRVDTSVLSEFAETTIRKNARTISEMTRSMGVERAAEKLHDEWKEWKNPGPSRLHLPLKEILTEGLGFADGHAARIASEDSYAKSVAEKSVLSSRSIVCAQ